MHESWQVYAAQGLLSCGSLLYCHANTAFPVHAVVNRRNVMQATNKLKRKSDSVHSSAAHAQQAELPADGEGGNRIASGNAYMLLYRQRAQPEGSSSQIVLPDE